CARRTVLHAPASTPSTPAPAHRRWSRGSSPPPSSSSTPHRLSPIPPPRPGPAPPAPRRSPPCTPQGQTRRSPTPPLASTCFYIDSHQNSHASPEQVSERVFIRCSITECARGGRSGVTRRGRDRRFERTGWFEDRGRVAQRGLDSDAEEVADASDVAAGLLDFVENPVGA